MYYFKESLFLFFYSLTMSFLSLAIMLIDNLVIEYIASFLSLGFYFFIMYYDMNSVGKKAQEQLYSNDTLRKRIIETGDDIEIKTMEEYKPFKGFLIGAFTCVPMVFFLLIHLIIVVCGGQTLVLGGISNFLYMVFSSPVLLIINSDSLTKWQYFISLYGIIVSSAVSGFGYIMGAKKSVLQHEKIIEKQKSIYGE